MSTDRPSTPSTTARESASGSRAGSAPGSARTELGVTRFRPQKTNFFIAGFLVLLAIVAMGFSLWFTPLLIAPIIFIVWVMRVRTTISDRGITAVYLLRGRRSLPWDRFRGVLFDRGGSAYAVGHAEGSDADANDVKFTLPAISFNSLPALSEASGGRIPDPVTPARLADDEKVEVFDRDGNSVKRPRINPDTKDKGDRGATAAGGTGAADATDVSDVEADPRG